MSGSVGTKYTFSSTASAPASSMPFAYLTHPPMDDPFRLAITGMERVRFTASRNSRYAVGPVL